GERGSDHDVHAAVDSLVVVANYVDRLIAKDLFKFVTIHLKAPVAYYQFSLVVPNSYALVVFDFFRPVVIYVDLLIAPHMLRSVATNIDPLVVLHLLLLIVLRVNIDQLRPLGIVQRDLVEAAAAFGAVRFDAADYRACGHAEGGHLPGVVHAARDNRLVGVAFQEINNHFLADSRDRDRSPALPG